MAGQHGSTNPDADGLTNDQAELIEELGNLLYALPTGRQPAFHEHLEQLADEEASAKEDSEEASPGSDS